MFRSLILGPRWYSSPLIAALIPPLLHRRFEGSPVLWERYQRAAGGYWFLVVLAVLLGLIAAMFNLFIVPQIVFLLASVSAAVNSRATEEELALIDDSPRSETRVNMLLSVIAPLIRYSLIFFVVALLANWKMFAVDASRMPQIMFEQRLILSGMVLFGIGGMLHAGMLGLNAPNEEVAQRNGLIIGFVYLIGGFSIMMLLGNLAMSYPTQEGMTSYAAMIFVWLATVFARLPVLHLARLDERDRRAQSAESSSEEPSACSSDCR